jgi:hypothetical protein
MEKGFMTENEKKWRIGVGKDFSDDLVCNLILEYLYEKAKLE